MVDHAARRGRLWAGLASHALDAALVTSLANVRYLTGFTGSNAALLVSAAPPMLATDSRYVTQAGRQCPDVELMVDRDVAGVLVAKARQESVEVLGVEEHDLTVELHRRLVERAQGLPLHDLERAVEHLRVVKDDDEIALLREACAISTRALAGLLDGPLLGRPEREVADELERRLKAEGADGLAFPTIVAAGEHSAIPHHEPTSREIGRGELVVIDFGARYQGYHADCTRTVVVGAEPQGWHSELYDVVRQAQRAGRRALEPGAHAREVDAAARDVVVEAGYGDYFGHGLGHGVGLEIHEAPMLGTTSTARLIDRTPVTVEPGIYLPGRGGVRIEDTLVVRDAAPELLTTFPKDLVVR